MLEAVAGISPAAHSGVTVLGPLPRRYSRRVVVAAILICAVLGVWLSRSIDLPMPVDGLLVGSLVGVVCAFLLVHDFTRRAAADPARSRSPRAP
jgi:tetrahydromethanopterin S-methyltransferase subunit C